MKHLKIILASLLIALCFTEAYAQKEKKSTMSLLTQNEWTRKISNEKEVIFSTYRFTPTEQVEINTFQDKEVESVYKYYLSNKPETTFDHEKVGKESKGRYLIRMDQHSVVTVYYIMRISEKVLELETSNPKERISTNIPTTVTITAAELERARTSATRELGARGVPEAVRITFRATPKK